MKKIKLGIMRGKGKVPIEYIEYKLVEKFGLGIYDLPAEKVNLFLQIMNYENEASNKKSDGRCQTKCNTFRRR